MSSKTRRLTKLSDALDALEDKLESLLSSTLVETGASLETLQEAKLNTVLPYLINDLIFIYLRTRGVDPKSHSVVTELERVKQYFDKIKESEAKQQKRAGIDKAAATRFIKHAIAQAQQTSHELIEDNETSEAGPSSAITTAPVRVTEKMIEREKYLKSLDDFEDDSMLQVFDKSQSPGDEQDKRVEGTAKGSSKKRRKAMDPFASLDSPSMGPSSSSESHTPTENKPEQGKKRRRKRSALDVA